MAHCRIVEGPIDIAEAIAAVAGPDRGAIATFSGTARDHHAGRRVVRLEYETYAAMAVDSLRSIGAEAAGRFGTPHVAILHRVGVVPVGDASVIIAVAAPHRREALAACAFIIDRVKEIAPIWKKEFYEDGASWIEGPETRPGRC